MFSLRHISVCATAILGLLAAGCTANNSGALSAKSAPKTPQSTMVHVAKRIQACWFKNGNAAFKPYRMAAEVNSFSGKPRVLIVPKNRPGGLPKLVVQAERVNGITTVSTFGPLLQSSGGARLESSVRHWARGNSSCV